MMNFKLIAAAAFVAAAFATPASAITTVYSTTLSGANESPMNASTAFGSAMVTYDSTLHTLLVSLTYTGLTQPAAAGHIHCCVSPGGNADVAVPFVGLPNAVSGSYSQTFALNSLATYTAAFLTTSGGTAAGAEALLASGLAAGTSYANLHDSVYPSGEIRGFLVSSVPEPTTTALMLLGLGAIGAIARRRGSKAPLDA